MDGCHVFSHHITASCASTPLDQESVWRCPRCASIASAGPPPLLPLLCVPSCTSFASAGPLPPLSLSRAPVARAWPEEGASPNG